MAAGIVIGARKWTPARLPKLAAWYRADDVVLSNGKVSRWTDRSGKNYPLEQQTANNQPVYEAAISGFGGRPALRFDGSQFLTWSGPALTLSQNLADGLTVVAVVNAQTTGATKNLAALELDNGTSNRIALILTSGQKVQVVVRTNNDGTTHNYTSTASWTTSDYACWTAVVDLVGGGLKLYKDGSVFSDVPGFVVGAPQATENTASQGGAVGATTTATLGHNGTLAELILCHTDLTPSDHNRLNQYLATRYRRTLASVF